MNTNNINSNLKFSSPTSAIWLWLSIVAALLAITGSIISLSVKSIYTGLTSAFLPQALAQDIANLAIVSPMFFNFKNGPTLTSKMHPPLEIVPKN